MKLIFVGPNTTNKTTTTTTTSNTQILTNKSSVKKIPPCSMYGIQTATAGCSSCGRKK